MVQIEYAKVGESFGSAMPHGSCNALINGVVCGYPMRSGDVCMNRDYHHPREPK